MSHYSGGTEASNKTECAAGASIILPDNVTRARTAGYTTLQATDYNLLERKTQTTNKNVMAYKLVLLF